MRSAVRLPTPGRAADGVGVARDDGGGEVFRRQHAQHGERRLRTDLADADQHLEQAASVLGGEAVKLQVVLADDEVGVQPHGAVRAGQAAEVVRGDEDAQQDAAADPHDDGVGVLRLDRALDARDDAHRARTRSAARRVCAWQSAMAIASDASSAIGSSPSSSRMRTERCTCALSPAP